MAQVSVGIVVAAQVVIVVGAFQPFDRDEGIAAVLP
jgi:hypothetical protein